MISDKERQQDKSGRELTQETVSAVERGQEIFFGTSELEKVYGILTNRVIQENGANTLSVSIRYHKEIVNALEVNISVQEKPSKWRRKRHIYDINFIACNNRIEPGTLRVMDLVVEGGDFLGQKVVRNVADRITSKPNLYLEREAGLAEGVLGITIGDRVRLWNRKVGRRIMQNDEALDSVK